jgi:2-C-methyl-D-erythritol 2,4-cyclodiphosphate synthase
MFQFPVTEFRTLDTGNWQLVTRPAIALTGQRLALESSHLNPQPKYRTGLGFDAHELVAGRRLMLGGVHITSKRGLSGHSDADVLLHALTDALLGALALPDIGALFPDTDTRWKDAPSELMLRGAYTRVRIEGFQLANADCVLVCDQPKLAPHALAIRTSIAGMLDVPVDRIGLQAKTTEGTQLALKRKSIAAMAIVLVTRQDSSRSPKSKVRSPGAKDLRVR